MTCIAGPILDHAYDRHVTLPGIAYFFELTWRSWRNNPKSARATHQHGCWVMHKHSLPRLFPDKSGCHSKSAFPHPWIVDFTFQRHTSRLAFKKIRRGVCPHKDMHTYIGIYVYKCVCVCNFGGVLVAPSMGMWQNITQSKQPASVPAKAGPGRRKPCQFEPKIKQKKGLFYCKTLGFLAVAAKKNMMNPSPHTHESIPTRPALWKAQVLINCACVYECARLLVCVGARKGSG